MKNLKTENKKNFKGFFFQNVIESFSFLCIEKLKNKDFLKKYKILKKKNIKFSNNAFFLLNLILKKFIIKYGDSLKNKLSAQRRNLYNSIDIIENNKIKNLFPNIQEIFWRKEKKISFLKVKNSENIKKKTIPKDINDYKKLYHLNDLYHLSSKNMKYIDCCKKKNGLKKKLKNLKFQEKI
jgi:hypothetical protein